MTYKREDVFSIRAQDCGVTIAMQAHIYYETDIEVTLRFEMNGELLCSKMKTTMHKTGKKPFRGCGGIFVISSLEAATRR